jgi:heat shock protein HslJ
MRRIGLRVAALAVAVGVAAACAATPSVTPAPTVAIGGNWTVVEASGIVAPPLNEPSFEFGGDPLEMRGGSACGDFRAPVAIEGSAIRVGELRGGGRQCPGPIAEVAEAFLRVVRTADRIEAGGGRLRLSGPGGELLAVRDGLVLTEDEQARSDRLEGHSWRLVEGTGIPDPSGFPSLSFRDGALRVEAPCPLSAEYDLRGEDLIIFLVTGPEPDGCPLPLGEVRGHLIEALDGVTRLAFDPTGEGLTFTGRETRVVFSADR